MDTIKLYSYLYGLFGTDGWIRFNNKKEIYELNIELIDKPILEKIKKELNNCSLSERKRDTNFKKNHISYIIRCRDKNFIEWIKNNNFPMQDKTNTISIPNNYSESDFWRGIIDGDGSIGLKRIENQPFISLTTKSESLKQNFCNYIEKLTNFRPNINRNKRDNIYNITLHGEKALIILNNIYTDANIYIDRKYESYLSIKDWKKQDKKIKRVKWTEEEEQFLKENSIENFLEKYPNRTRLAIKGKIQKLKKEGKWNE